MIALKGRRPIYFGLVALVLDCVLLWGFVSALIHSSPGEVAEAIGSVVGGIFGAGGAVGAVYFLIDRQRHEDANNVSDAIRREIIIFTEVVIEALSKEKRPLGAVHGDEVAPTNVMPRAAASYGPVPVSAARVRRHATHKSPADHRIRTLSCDDLRSAPAGDEGSGTDRRAHKDRDRIIGDAARSGGCDRPSADPAVFVEPFRHRQVARANAGVWHLDGDADGKFEFGLDDDCPWIAGHRNGTGPDYGLAFRIMLITIFNGVIICTIVRFSVFKKHEPQAIRIHLE